MEQSLPPLLHGRVYADFREPKVYFSQVINLVLALYEIPLRDPIVEELERLLAENTGLLPPTPA